MKEKTKETLILIAKILLFVVISPLLLLLTAALTVIAVVAAIGAILFYHIPCLIGRFIKYIRPVVMMQLRDKMDMSFLRSRKALLFKSVFFILVFGVYCIVILGVFKLGIMFNILTLTWRLPETLIVMIFTLMLALSTINCTFGLTKNLYMADDNKILLTLPLKPNVVFISKLIVFYIRELQRNIFFVVPMFWVFGYINGFNFMFFPLVVFMYFFISLLPVIIGALLSIPALYISMLLRNFKIVQFAIYAALGGGLVYLVFQVINGIPENFNLIQEFATYQRAFQGFLSKFAESVGPLNDLTRMITGRSTFFMHQTLPASSIATFGLLIAFLTVLGIVIFFVTRPLFLIMASKPFEYRKKLFKFRKKNRTAPQYLSLLKKEIYTTIRTPENFLRDFGVILILPLAIFLLNKVFAAMDTRMLGDYLSLSFSVLMIILMLLCSNVGVASLLSREGPAFYHLKTTPSSPQKKLAAKLTIKIASSFIALSLTCAVLFTFASVPNTTVIQIFVFVLFLITMHALWSLELDFMNPKYAFYNDERTTINNPNENKSYIIAFSTAFAAFGAALWLLLENPTVAWWKLIAISAGLLVWRIVAFTQKTNVYYREM